MTDFASSTSNAIFIQIAERICDSLLAGEYAADGGRLPSVREYAALVEVNANTVMRSYELLARRGIIATKRGIGFFATPEARELILQDRRATFMAAELPAMFKRMQQLGIAPARLAEMYTDYLTSSNSK